MIKPRAQCTALAALAFSLSACIHDGSTLAAGERLTDPQVITALVAIHEAEIAAARIAMRKSVDVEVQGFATRMQTEHGEAIERLQAIGAARDYSPEGTDLSMAIARESGDVCGMLEAEGTAFDLLYARSRYEGHRSVLQRFDEVLLPSIRDRALRAEAEAERAAVLREIEHTERLSLTQGMTAR